MKGTTRKKNIADLYKIKSAIEAIGKAFDRILENRNKTKTKNKA